MRLMLSWVLSGLNGLTPSDDRIQKIRSELDGICDRLKEVVERHFPLPANPDSPVVPTKTLRKVGTNPEHRLTYCSPRMHEVMGKVERAAKRDVPILVMGETG